MTPLDCGKRIIENMLRRLVLQLPPREAGYSSV